MSEDKKKIVFYDTLDRQTRFRVRLQHDSLNQSQFFRMMITGYTENDPDLLAFLDKCKEKELIQGKAKRDSNKLSVKKGLQNKTKFALDDADIESIFDIIQKEHPDL